jgi:hypothetical protein
LQDFFVGSIRLAAQRVCSQTKLNRLQAPTLPAMRPLLFAIAALSLAAPAALPGAIPVRQPALKELLASCDPAIVHAAAVEIGSSCSL